MMQLERQKKILDYLNKNRKATTKELSQLLDVSATTIRTDLNQMDKEKLITKTHGGAVYNDRSLDNIELTGRAYIFDERALENRKEKEAIASKAIKLIKNHMCIYLDASSTCYTLGMKLSGFTKLTVITNGINLALALKERHYGTKAFVPAGQSTQMVIGASDESDYQIISVSEALYQKFEMKRIFYSAFINVNHDSSLPDLPGPPLLREHRLYQADFLLRFYGFRADELLSEKNPNFNEQIDPKCNWAVHHLELFPVEINRADYYTLLRVPGIGTKSARRIMAARRYAKLDFSDLKKIGVVLKRAVYFITCKGKMMYHTRMEEGYITRNLMYQERPMQMLLSDGTVQSYEQLSLFDDRGKIVV